MQAPPSSSAPSTQDDPKAGRGGGRRLLLVSCEFDATRSPQGMRWVMLARELAELGWQVDVVTFRDPGDAAESTSASLRNPHVHRVFPGPYQAALARLRGKRPAVAPTSTPAASAEPASGSAAPARLNWKGRLDARLRRWSSYALYPDLRREGLPFLRSCVERLIAQHRYAAAVLSHEPPLALELRALLERAGIPVVADLGDPVLAGYTPRCWRRRAARLEADICERAHRIVVTSEATKTLLLSRHRIDGERIGIVTQGHHPGSTDAVAATPSTAPLRLVYTGRFYRFRDPRPIFAAVAATADVVMTYAVPQMPDWIDAADLAAPKFDARGALDHPRAVALQASADVLLVIGNDDPTQVPGKLYEYFGQPLPILYVTAHPHDAGARLVERLRRGLVAEPRADALRGALAELVREKREHGLGRRFDLSRAAVAEYSWAALAARYSALLERAVSTGRIRALP